MLEPLLSYRFIGGDKIPEFWGKPSAYTEGTEFLGTPKDHLQVAASAGSTSASCSDCPELGLLLGALHCSLSTSVRCPLM